MTLMMISFSSMAKYVYVKCEVISNEDGTVVLNCQERNLDKVVPGEKVKVKVTVNDDPVGGC
jgi:hypothetical protein